VKVETDMFVVITRLVPVIHVFLFPDTEAGWP